MKLLKSKTAIFLIILLAYACFYFPGRADAQSNLSCSICGNQITSKYWSVGGSIICDECYNTVARCRMCGVPSKRMAIVEGSHICPNCYNKLDTCNKCGSKMLQTWKMREPDGSLKLYCKKCIQQGLGNCKHCGAPLSGQAWKLVSCNTGRICWYCANCKKKAKSCFACKLYAKPNSFKLPDGRCLCDDCARATLSSKNQYDSVYADVRNIFKSLGLRHNYNHRLNVVSLPVLLRNKGQAFNPNEEVQEMGLFKAEKIVRKDFMGKESVTFSNGNIYVLDYLPSDIAMWVIAHEYGHAWYHERVNDAKGKIIEEGFAEWIAYKTLKKKKLDYIADSIKNRNDVYGRGLRRMLDIEQKKGFQGVLDFVTR